MLMEPIIQRLFSMEEPFENSYFADLDEYDALKAEYLNLFCGLEETLDDKSFNALENLIRCQEEMEEFRAMHHFRQGVVMGMGTAKKDIEDPEEIKRAEKKETIDIPIFH